MTYSRGLTGEKSPGPKKKNKKPHPLDAKDDTVGEPHPPVDPCLQLGQPPTTSYRIGRAWCKIKMRGPVFNNFNVGGKSVQRQPCLCPPPSPWVFTPGLRTKPALGPQSPRACHHPVSSSLTSLSISPEDGAFPRGLGCHGFPRSPPTGPGTEEGSPLCSINYQGEKVYFKNQGSPLQTHQDDCNLKL